MLKIFSLLVSHPRYWATCLLVWLSLITFTSSSVGEIDVEYLDIGTGQDCFSFAIFADPHVVDPPANHTCNLKLGEAVNKINDLIINQGKKIRFVMVVGDIIHGQQNNSSAYADHFNRAKDGNPPTWSGLDDLSVPYIPLIGNHDEYCLWSSYTGASPEKVFNEIFNEASPSVYRELSTALPNWKKLKKEDMENGNPTVTPNPYNLSFPSCFFQNFAFDFGPYHFICLDFCSRNEFNTSPSFYGWADLYDFPSGTLGWFRDHLASVSSNLLNESVIIFSHHPPSSNILKWSFDGTEYQTILTALSPYADKIRYWFAGHSHINDDWALTNGSINICDARTVASTWDHTYGNPNGYLLIVQVKHPTGGSPEPDPFISTVVGDNPDIVLYKEQSSGSNAFTTSVPWGSNLDPFRLHQIRATIRNGGCLDANVHISFTWSNWGIGSVDQTSGFSPSAGVTPPNPSGTYGSGGEVTGVDIPSGVTDGRGVYVLWNSGEIFGGDTTNYLAHGCIRVRIEPQNGDIRPDESNNNMGQENIDVNPTKKSLSMDTIRIPIPVYDPKCEPMGMEVVLEVTPTEGGLWNATVHPDTLTLPPCHPPCVPPCSDTAYLILCPVESLNVGDVENFRVTGRRVDNGELIGGVEIASLIDDPPILEYVGDNGYTSEGVEPDTGDPATEFVFRVKYRDDNNHRPAPGYPLLYLFKGNEQVQGSPFVMGEEDQSDLVYTNGKIYLDTITLSEPGNDYKYFFWARDELEIAAGGPATQITPGPVVTEPINKVEIAQIESANPGDIVSLPVLMKNPEAVGGFDLYIEFDPTVLHFKGVERGSGLPEGFEYFTYRQLPCPNCGCCKYKLQVLGLYDLKDIHQGIPIPPRDYQDTLFKIVFQVAYDQNLRGFKIPVKWEWDDEICTENTKSDTSGYVLYVSLDTTQFNPNECPTQPGSQVIPSIYFIDGGVEIATTGEKKTGDINLNGIPFDPGDVTLFSSYFIYGLEVFVIDPPLQIGLTDINRDGFTLSLSDFIYMLRVILGDVSKPKPAPTEQAVTINTIKQNSHVRLTSDQPLGAALLVLDYTGEVNNLSSPFATNSNIEVSKNELRILVYMKDASGISGELLSFQATGMVKLSKAEAVDIYGRKVEVVAAAKTIPEKFALYQNYPNPFNLETQISFDLPVNSKTSLKIYNISGQLVRTLLDKDMEAGQHRVLWDGKNQEGEEVASGIYFYRIAAGSYTKTAKMSLLK